MKSCTPDARLVTTGLLRAVMVAYRASTPTDSVPVPAAKIAARKGVSAIVVAEQGPLAHGDYLTAAGGARAHRFLESDRLGQVSAEQHHVKRRKLECIDADNGNPLLTRLLTADFIAMTNPAVCVDDTAHVADDCA